MKLSKFIRENTEAIILDWEQFARVALPAGTVEQRRDHVAKMLHEIALDLARPQTKQEQADKSKGENDSTPAVVTAANAHGTERAASGHSPEQMVAEFRALRASVMKHFAEANHDIDRASLEDVTRFNEAIDQALAESMATFVHGVDRSRDLFLGVLGHDLRNPLGAIMMGTTVIMTQEGPNWPHANAASRIITSATRMGEMINDLLDFTRTRLGDGIPVAPEPIDLEAVCRQAVDEVMAFHPDCVIHFDCSGDLHGSWDPGRIAQMLSNIVGNAYQHGTKHVPIEVTLGGDRDQVVLAVVNQGITIPEDRLQDIFDPFRQLNSAAAKKDPSSIGLGLYIAQAIAIAHDGTIDVESNRRGTIFTVRLPRAGAPAIVPV